jgi:hypothetical protein
MNTTRRCAACGLEISPSLTGKYCYNHQQIFDSLVAEHKAFLDTNNAISWKDFLSKKLNDRMGNEVEKVINRELNSLY